MPSRDGVVDAREHGRAGAEALDQVDLPQRAAVVQRRGRQVADQLAQRARGRAAPAARSGGSASSGRSRGSSSQCGAGQRPAGAGDLPEAREALDDALDVVRAQRDPSPAVSSNHISELMTIRFVALSIRSQAASAWGMG